MKLLLIASLVALAVARPQDEFIQDTFAPAPVPEGDSLQDYGILRMDMSTNDDGSFQYGFETTDPIVQDVSGAPKQIADQIGITMQGTYSFTAKDENGNDVPVTIDWTADENGFQAQGDAIPVAPEDPNAAAQAAAYEAAGGVPQQEFTDF